MVVSTSSQILPPPVGEQLQADLGISRKVLNASPANGAARARHRRDAGPNMTQGWSHGPVGAVIAAWPAVSLVDSYELLVWIIRAAAAGHLDRGPAADHGGRRPTTTYTAAKAGVVQLSRDLGVHLARSDTCVNVVLFGPIEPPLQRAILERDPSVVDRRLVHWPMGRFGAFNARPRPADATSLPRICRTSASCMPRSAVIMVTRARSGKRSRTFPVRA